MNYVLRLLSLFTVVTATALNSSAQSGFVCSDPIPLTCGSTNFGSTTGVSNDNSTSGASLCGTAVGTAGQVWYIFTSPGFGTCIMNTETSITSYDTKLHVYTGQCGNLTCVTGDDDSGTGLLSSVTFPITTGTTYLVRVGGYTNNAGNYQLNVICDIPTIGCTDPGACNYSPSVITDDGSCEYTSCAGCTDNGACNFDPLASIPALTECEYTSCAGCTDNTACNYDASATIADPTACCYVGCNYLSVTSGTFPGEVGWQLLDTSGTVIISAAAPNGAPISNLGFCVTPGCNFQFVMTDTFGDGWNGANFTITDEAGAVQATGTLGSGSGPVAQIVSLGGAVAGCTNPAANNYSILATCDDGSCVYCAGGESNYSFNMFDSGNNGWGNNAQAVITDLSTGTVVLNTTLATGGTGQVDVCLGTQCYSVVVGGGNTDFQISWSITDANGYSLTGAANTPTGLVFNTLGETSGCTNPQAANYNASATCDDGSCLVCDAGEIVYTLDMLDAFGDGWNGGAALIYDLGTGNLEASAELIDGASGSASFCLGTTCYNIVVGGGTWDSEISWTLSNSAGYTLSGLANDPAGQIFSPGGLQVGCTDPTATNYNPAAQCDDGTCIGCPSGQTVYTINMFDSGNNGWQGANWTILDTAGATISFGTLSAGGEGFSNGCLSPGCYEIQVGAGSQPAQISWDITTQDGNIFLEGIANTTTAFAWAGAAGCTIAGCTNAECFNFNPYAVEDDGSCICPPVNDSCFDATEILCGEPLNGTMAFSTSDPGAVSCDATNAITTPGVWYHYVGAGGQVTAATCGGTAQDTKLHIFTGTCDNLQCLTQNDDGCGAGFLSSVSFTAESGTDYWILVSRYSAFSSDAIPFTLTLTCADCPNGLAVNDNCVNALPLTSGQSISGSLCCSNADNEMSPWDGFTTQYGIWYSINSADFAALDISFFNGLGQGVDSTDGLDVGIGVFVGNPDCDSLTAVIGGVGFDSNPNDGSTLDGFQFNSAEYGIDLVPNANYYLCLTTSNPSTCGDFVLNVTLSNLGCTDSLACNYDPTANLADGSCEYASCGYVPANDLCANAIQLTCEETVGGSTGGSTNTGAPTVCPSGAGDNGVWYVYQGTEDLLVTLNTCGSVIDSRIAVLTSSGGCAGTFACEASNDDNAAECGFFDQDDATVQFAALAGTTYYIYVSAGGVDTDGDNIDDLLDGAFELSSSCVPIVFGCLDVCACNYDAAANTDNGSCDYFSCAQCGPDETAVRFNMTDTFGDGWNGSSYSISDLAGNVVAQGSLDNASCITASGNFGASAGFDVFCLPDGCYSMTLASGTFPTEVGWSMVTSSGTVVVSASSPNGTGTFDFVIGTGSCGCTNAQACNYDASATIDDGSCCLGTCATLNMFDSFGDGWNGAVASIFDYIANASLGTATLTGQTSAGTADFCLVDGCYSVDVTAGTFPAEVSWILSNIAGDTLATGGAPVSVPFTVGENAACGCTDATACNYNPDAVADNGTCEYTSCVGCTASAACNFSPVATVDDGSCCFSNCATLNMFDSFGDGWNGAVAGIADYNTGVLIGSTATLPNGTSEGTANFCLVDGCYEVQVTAGTFPNEIDWTLTDPSGAVLASGGAPEAGVSFGIGATSPCGCTNPNACNYNPNATIDIGNCDTLSCLGCTDPTACNYDLDATQDDGTCCFSTCATLNMEDSFGDGWNGSIATISDFVTGSVIGTGTLPAGTSSGTADFCLVDGCYTVAVTAGTFPTEVSWTLNSVTSELLASGGAPANIAFNIGDAPCGCTNPSACNYDPTATIDNGTCDTLSCLGCTDPGACNFDTSATQDDGTCCFNNCFTLNLFDSGNNGWNGATLFIRDVAANQIVQPSYSFTSGGSLVTDVCLVDGCYDVTVTVGTAPAQVSWNLSGSQGIIISGGAGQNNVPFTAGSVNCSAACMDAAACNFDATAIFSDSTLCDYLSCIGCSDTSACNYDINAPIGSNDCDYSCIGCSDVAACNYSSIATINDGSCVYPGCQDATACNYSAVAGCDDGSCTFAGCTNAAACNFNPAAGCDDGSCCLSNCVTLSLSATGGNGWQGAFLSAINAVTGEEVINATLESGALATADYCIASGCYDVSVTGGSSNNEISWSLAGESAGANSVTTVAIGVPSCDPFCLIPLACNYNSQGVIGDCNLCEFDSCQGCTYPDATNYDANATIDDGSCIFQLGNPNCPADINGDGFVSVADLLIFIAEYGTICN